MLLVTPVHAKNAPLYAQISKLFAKIGPNAGHDLLVLSCPTTLEAAQEFGESVSRLFREVKVVETKKVVADLLRGRNQMFRHAAELAAEAGQPWIWMEDAYPTQRRWLDNVEAEYNKNTTLPFLGVLEEAYEKARDVDGKLLSGQFDPKGPFMRFGVYPADFNGTSTLLRFLDLIPFEHYLRGDIINKARPSETMASVWASVNFERNSSELIEGEQSPEYESSLRKDEKRTADDRSVSVIHGCRDGSLGFVLLRKTFLSPEAAMQAKQKKELEEAEQEQERMATELTEVTEERNQLSHELNNLRQTIEELQGQIIEAQEESPGSEKQIEEYEQKLAKKEGVIANHKSVLAETEKELRAVKKERTALRSKVTKLENQMATA